jgi:hypothetical protein
LITVLLPFCCRPPDAERRAGAQQLFVDHGAAVVQVEGLRDPAGGDAVAQRGFEPDGLNTDDEALPPLDFGSPPK